MGFFEHGSLTNALKPLPIAKRSAKHLNNLVQKMEQTVRETISNDP